MSQTETFQLSVAAAEAYESKFVPALFAEWAPLLVDAAGVTTGQAVLDVACGTGVVAREAAERGLKLTATETHVGTARFESIEELVRIEVESTPLIDRIDDDTYGAIIGDARTSLAQFETPDGKAEIPIVGHILSARR